VGALPAARTLHRLLGQGRARAAGLDGEALTHGPRFPLPYDAVIVDEASMIDLFLMRSLVAALAPGARLVLLGDADQLPSIRAGSVFADLCQALPDRCVIRLTRSHRMSPADPAGAEILRVATAANQGEIPPGALAARASPGDLAGTAVERLPSSQLGPFVEHWYRALRERVGATGASDLHVYECSSGGRLEAGDRAVERLLAAHSAERVLCVTRRGFAGRSADELNAAFHAMAATAGRARGEIGDLPFSRGATATAGSGFLPGEPVMVLRNDYRRGLFNGDQGLVLRVRGADRSERLGVAFRQADGVRVFPLAELATGTDLGLAYAVTVHKAQGSELERAALILPNEDLPLLSRELVYTALSRARRHVVIVGDPDVLALAVGRRLPRRSGLPARLLG
jgi:exodeoxyribonuclease V alpha subunit